VQLLKLTIPSFLTAAVGVKVDQLIGAGWRYWSMGSAEVAARNSGVR